MELFARVLHLCSFSLCLLSAITPAPLPQTLESLVPPCTCPLVYLCLCHALWEQRFLHGRQLKSCPFKAQPGASYSRTPSPVQQLFIHSFHHSFKPYLKPVQGQKLGCQALGSRDKSHPGSAFKSFPEE